MASALHIKGRDAFSSTSHSGNVYQAPINIGTGTSLGVSPLMMGLAAVAVFLLMVRHR